MREYTCWALPLLGKEVSGKVWGGTRPNGMGNGTVGMFRANSNYEGMYLLGTLLGKGVSGKGLGGGLVETASRPGV